jgi:RNA-binding protein
MIRKTTPRSRPGTAARGTKATQAAKSKRAATAAKAAKTAAAAKASASPPAAPAQLSERQRRYLKGLAHPLKPLIRMGNAGLTEGVAAETARALHDHELIKVKAPGGNREARDAAFTQLAERTASSLVHRIGNVAVLYRPRPEMPRILIPD